MKKLYALIILCSLTITYSNAQTLVSAWTFDATAAAPNTPNSLVANQGSQLTATLYADGTNGSSTWITATTGNELTAFGGTVVNDPRGVAVAGNAYSLVAGTGFSANGKAIVIKLSLSGFINPILSYATRNTATGFQTQQWAYSTDNSVYTNFGTVGAITTTFVTKTLDLSSIDAVDQQATVYLRLIVTGATNSTGNNRLDNIQINATSAPLPISLLSFTAKKLSEKVQLNWSTASEINNAKFNVERSSDGKEFTSIGELNGAGNSNRILNYTFMDENPAKGMNYYQLRQTDFNGESSLSKIVAVRVDAREMEILTVRAQDAQIHLEVSSPLETKTVLIVHDMNGKLILQKEIQLEAGHNEFRFPSAQIVPGIHLIRLSSEEGVVSKKFLF